jgi:predicted unusual protein kinase regulating ubiquinone biosynthesis (AarF/ABC1/UbiB family)
MTDRKLPTSRLSRFARLASLGARAGLERVAGALGKADAHQDLAAAATEALGTMRGLALKVGQMASYVDGLVPEEHREAYEQAMRALRDSAPTMSPEAAARVITAELGASPERLFAEWSPVPFAAASIGQVHRARLTDGREVAVKVQYEGVAKAVAADLANGALFTSLLGPFGAKFGLKEQLGEVRARFTEELDYLHEAEAQRAFAEHFAGDPRVRIPWVIDDRSSRRVITTELVTGRSFEAACRAGEDERRAWAETLWRFVFGAMLGRGYFNADPHPGNYIFGEGGQVWFLDFGCTRTFDQADAALIRQAHSAVSRGDEAGFYRFFFRLLDLPEEGAQSERGREYMRLCFLPLFASGPFKITRAYSTQLMEEMRENAKIMAMGSRRDYRPLPPQFLFLNRLQLGFYSVLARLDVAADYRAVEAELLARATL